MTNHLRPSFLTGRFYEHVGMTHVDMNFEIFTLRHDTGNRFLDYAFFHAVIEPAYKF